MFDQNGGCHLRIDEVDPVTLRADGPELSKTLLVIHGRPTARAVIEIRVCHPAYYDTKAKRPEGFSTVQDVPLIDPEIVTSGASVRLPAAA